MDILGVKLGYLAAPLPPAAAEEKLWKQLAEVFKDAGRPSSHYDNQCDKYKLNNNLH